MSKEKSEEAPRDRPVKRAKYVAKNLPGNSQSSISGGALGPGESQCAFRKLSIKVLDRENSNGLKYNCSKVKWSSPL